MIKGYCNSFESNARRISVANTIAMNERREFRRPVREDDENTAQIITCLYRTGACAERTGCLIANTPERSDITVYLVPSHQTEAGEIDGQPPTGLPISGLRKRQA